MENHPITEPSPDFFPHPVRNVALPIPLLELLSCRHNLLCWQIYLRGTPRGMFLTVVGKLIMVTQGTVLCLILKS